jgi:putative ABC transport system ATP-binding protein
MTIELRDISKSYWIGENEVHALREVSLRIQTGELAAITGPSGSGKSTLMNIIGCLDQPTSGSYQLDGTEVGSLDDDDLADLRNHRTGFVFQAYNLLPRMTALEQVEVPLLYRREHRHRELAAEALKTVGLADRMGHKPTELSGGQSQRVAIARALVTEPSIILADEPTGALDSRTSEEIMALLQQLNHSRNITVVLITHEPEIAAFTRRTIQLRDGCIVGDTTHDMRRAVSHGPWVPAAA